MNMQQEPLTDARILLDPIADAIDEIRAGKMVVVVDDEDRENEGDVICASACITPEIVNFMVREARGLICVSLLPERCTALDLGMMVTDNTAMHETAFTMSVDLLGHGNTTGVSAADRARTIKALTAETAAPGDFARPGHIFPLKANAGGVLGRDGHTEAGVDLARMAGLYPSGTLVEVLNEDGSMARLPELRVFADKHGMKLISIKDLIEYRRVNDC